MAQADGVVANGTGSAVRSDINTQYAALWSNHSGSTEPSSGKVAYQFWADTNTSILKIRNSANNAWINLFTLAGGIDVDAASNFNEDVTFTGASYNLVWDKSDSALEFADNAKATFGADADLQVFHNSTNSEIKNATGTLYLESDNTWIVDKEGSDKMAKFLHDGAVELYYDNSKKFEVISSGAYVYGNLYANDNDQHRFGNDGDLQIYHDASDSYLTSATGELRVYSNGGILRMRAKTNENAIIAVPDGGVQLYYDNSKQFETFNSGIITKHVQPDADDDHDVGSSSKRFDNIHASNGTIQTSDRNEKENITDTDLGLDFINKLKPISFKFKNKTRTHYGLVAQEIETVITDLGKTTTQFAPLVKSTLEDGTERYGLRYTEFISPLIKAIQELSAEVETLKTKVAALESA